MGIRHLCKRQGRTCGVAPHLPRCLTCCRPPWAERLRQATNRRKFATVPGSGNSGPSGMAFDSDGASPASSWPPCHTVVLKLTSQMPVPRPTPNRSVACCELGQLGDRGARREWRPRRPHPVPVSDPWQPLFRAQLAPRASQRARLPRSVGVWVASDRTAAVRRGGGRCSRRRWARRRIRRFMPLQQNYIKNKRGEPLACATLGAVSSERAGAPVCTPGLDRRCA